MFIGKPICVAPVGDRCGEGVMWDDSDGAVFWVDIMRFLIHRLDPLEQTVKTWIFDEPVVGLAPTNVIGTLVLSFGGTVVLWDWKQNRRSKALFSLPDWPCARLNETRADPQGNFWLGSMKNNVLTNGEPGEVGKGLGVLYRMAPDLSVSVWRTGLGISNTLCWNAQQTKFYFADTLENDIRAYDFGAADADIHNEQSFFRSFDRGCPDGSAIDEQGYLWNCRFGGACIVRIAPSGHVDAIVEMPEENITTCCFGGDDLKSLYISSASWPHRVGDRLGGSLYRLDVGVRGVATHRFGASVSVTPLAQFSPDEAP